MLKRMQTVVTVAAFVAACALPVNAAEQKPIAPKPQDKVALREEAVLQLLPLVDAGKDGTISRQDSIKSMEAEFDRLDKNKNGVLDVRQISQSRYRAIPGSALLGK